MTDFKLIAKSFHLLKGGHVSPEDGLCAMEAVAWLEGLPHSDRPDCTCPVIGRYVMTLNDGMPDDERQRLIPYLPRLVGTVSPKHEQERGEFLAWQAVKVFAPKALDAAGLHEHAKKLRDCKTLSEAESYAKAARAAGDAARAAARAAGDAAGAANATGDAAASGNLWDDALAALDGVLKIGPQSPGFSKPVEDRVKAYRELIRA